LLLLLLPGPGGKGFHVSVINSIAEVRGVVTVKTYDEVVVPDTLPPPQQQQEREQEEQRRLRSYAGRCRSWEIIGGRKTRNGKGPGQLQLRLPALLSAAACVL
jgi:hypothetical protein